MFVCASEYIRAMDNTNREAFRVLITVDASMESDMSRDAALRPVIDLKGEFWLHSVSDFADGEIANSMPLINGLRRSVVPMRASIKCFLEMGKDVLGAGLVVVRENEPRWRNGHGDGGGIELLLI